MSEAAVMECIRENDAEAKTYASWMAGTGRSVSRTNIDQSTISQTHGEVTGRPFRCELTRRPETVVNGRTFNLDNTRYHLLIASGTDMNDATSIGFHDIGFTATRKVKLSDIQIYGELPKLEFQLHGAFMVIAWMGTTSIGIICARYFKSSFPGKKVYGRDLWFIVSSYENFHEIH